MNEIQFLRFKCVRCHSVTAVRYAAPKERTSLDYCPTCGEEDVQQIGSQTIGASVMADAGLISLEDKRQ